MYREKKVAWIFLRAGLTVTELNCALNHELERHVKRGENHSEGALFDWIVENSTCQH